MTALLVVLGGAVGAPARYLVDQLLQTRLGRAFPWGTLAVNVAGSLLLGLVAGLVAADRAAGWVLTVVGAGFCGALTTFSAFSFETFRLAEAGRWVAALLNVTVSVALGLGAAALGWWAGT